jgi:transposase-like protein
MITYTCRRCQSSNLKKNGHTPKGHQKMRCNDCGFASTLNTQDQQRTFREQQVEKLSLERLSQRAIARSTGISRMTIAKIQHKKSLLPPPL